MAYYNPYTQLIDQAKAAPIAGVASGFATGGPIGAVIGGITGLINRRRGYQQADQMVGALESPDLVDTDVYGRPTFNSAAALQTTQDITGLQNAVKKGKRGFRKLFRSQDDIMLAHKMGMQSENLQQGLQAGRNQFNTQMMDFNNRQSAMTQYNQLLNNQNRLNSLYSIGTSLY